MELLPTDIEIDRLCKLIVCANFTDFFIIIVMGNHFPWRCMGVLTRALAITSCQSIVEPPLLQLSVSLLGGGGLSFLEGFTFRFIRFFNSVDVVMIKTNWVSSHRYQHLVHPVLVHSVNLQNYWPDASSRPKCFGVHEPCPCCGGQETEQTNFIDRMSTATQLTRLLESQEILFCCLKHVDYFFPNKGQAIPLLNNGHPSSEGRMCAKCRVMLG